MKVLSCLNVLNIKLNGYFISVNDWKLGWILFVDNEFVLCNLVRSQWKSKHCSSIYMQFSAKSTKVASGARNSSSDVKTIQKDGSVKHTANRFWKGSYGQTQEFCWRPTTQNTKQLRWNNLDKISEMVMKASLLLCFDQNVYLRVSYNRRKGVNGAWEGRKWNRYIFNFVIWEIKSHPFYLMRILIVCQNSWTKI